MSSPLYDKFPLSAWYLFDKQIDILTEVRSSDSAGVAAAPESSAHAGGALVVVSDLSAEDRARMDEERARMQVRDEMTMTKCELFSVKNILD